MHSHFVGLDVHKQVIAYCVKTAAGEIVKEGKIAAKRAELDKWMKTLPTPWVGGMEATMFSSWIYRHLEEGGANIEMGHPAQMKAISAGKKKSDKLDARTIADLLRCNMFPTCYVIAPELEGLRRQIRFRRLVVKEHVTFRNKTAGLLMECGVEYERKRLHGKQYFAELMKNHGWVNRELEPLLRFNRSQIQTLQQMDQRILALLSKHPRLRARSEALQSIPGVGPVTALTWALETGTPERFASIKHAQSYCGLTSALRESAGHQKRGPLSKQRNRHLQCVLIEAAKLAPIANETLKAVHQKAMAAGRSGNEATLAVGRKMVAYLLAVDRAFLAQQRASAAV
jgi:transposase